MNIVVEANPNLSDIIALKKGITAYNDEKLNFESKSIYIFLRDQNQVLKGGIIAWYDIDSIYIDTIWIDQSFRGKRHGTRLLQTAEKEGVKAGCKFCTLDTFGFQAENFYLKNGYEKIGEIKNYIRHYSRIFFRKQLK